MLRVSCYKLNDIRVIIFTIFNFQKSESQLGKFRASFFNFLGFCGMENVHFLLCHLLWNSQTMIVYMSTNCLRKLLQICVQRKTSLHAGLWLSHCWKFLKGYVRWNLEDLTTKEKTGRHLFTCLFSLCSANMGKKKKVWWSLCGVAAVYGHPLGSQTSKCLFVFWGASLFLSLAIKEHHQGDKDLIKDMSVNDMRRWKQHFVTHPARPHSPHIACTGREKTFHKLKSLLKKDQWDLFSVGTFNKCKL